MSLEEFIKTRIESIDDLRALMLFYRDPLTECDAVEIGGKLYLPSSAAAAVLARLCAQGMLVAHGGPPRYRFQPHTPELAQLIAGLAELDRERPVTLIKMIYDRPRDIEAFANAFKIKKGS